MESETLGYITSREVETAAFQDGDVGGAVILPVEGCVLSE